MKNLEISKENIKFNNWMEVYVGFLHSWISASDILKYIENKKIDFCSEEKYIELYWALKESVHDFTKHIGDYIEVDLGYKITFNVESLNMEQLIEQIPDEFFKIWELEFLLRIRNSDRTLSDKIYDIYLTWCDFKYFNVRWEKFLWVNNIDNGDENELYNNFLNYIDFLKQNISE